MRRSIVRPLAFVILVLLGGPVAMHVLVHDLHEHVGHQANANVADADHGDHDHPIVSSPAPRMSSIARSALPIVALSGATRTASAQTMRMERNVIAHGALRLDHDVGLQLFLSTFLI